MSEFERIVTEIPGPRSRELAARLRATESRGVTFLSDDFPTFWESARGATVTDVDGNRFIDLTSAFGVAFTGHANTAVTSAIAEQAARLAHGMGDVHPSNVKQALLDKLVAIAPTQRSKAFLCSTGSEAVEFALKTALLATGRPNALSFAGAYHGLAHGALEVTGIEKFRLPFLSQLRAANRFVAYPDRRDPAARARVLEAVEATLRADETLGAVIVEPIQGRAGVIIPPDGFLRGLRAACDAHGALLIVDEIYTGFGRTGSLFAVEHDGVHPDLLCAGKALAGGFPLAVTLGSARVMDAWAPSQGEALHTSTYLGNPMGCAAALANINDIEQHDLVARARDLAAAIETLLAPLLSSTAVRDVRGRGALWAVECNDGATAHAWSARALRRGVIVLQSGPSGQTLTIAPPVVVEPAQLERAVAILAETAP